MQEATGLIRIKKIPQGEAPMWVRSAWVGCRLPCLPIIGYPGNGEKEKGLISKENITYGGCNRRGVAVPQKEALEILAKRSQDAANWFYEQGFPRPAPEKWFCFGEDEVEIISGVFLQENRQFLGLLEVGAGGHDAN